MSNHARQLAERSGLLSSALPGVLAVLARRLEEWYLARVFSVELGSLPRGRRAWNHLLRVVYLSVRGAYEDACLFRASALTYITVLSLVPLLAFVFAVSKSFGFYQTLTEEILRPWMDRTFGPLLDTDSLVVLPGSGQHEVRYALERVLGFVDSAHVGGLGAFGLVLLLLTVIKLLSTVEQSFNHIWGVQRSRSLVRKLTDYLAMVVVAPVLFVAAFGLTTLLQNSSVMGFVRTDLGLGPLLEGALRLAPLLSLWVAFAFLYLAMPNARTRWSSALVGALVGGTLWQVSLMVHNQFQLGIARYNAFYAGFAALPIFLVWVQTSWVCVLLGAEVCFAHQSAASYYPDSAAATSLRERERIALRSMARIAARALRAEPPWTAAELARELNVSLRPLELVLNELVVGGMLAIGRGRTADTYLLALDLDLIQVKSVLDLLHGPGTRPGDAPAPGVDAELAACLYGLDEAQAESRHNLGLRVLAEHELGAAQRSRATELDLPARG